MNVNAWLYRTLSQQRWFARRMAGTEELTSAAEGLGLSRHAVICGYGDVGERLAQVLDKQKFSYLVIDLDPKVISKLRTLGIPCIYGDASNPEILSHAAWTKRVCSSVPSGLRSRRLTAKNARMINPKLDIIARVHRDEDVNLLKNIGVTELVLPFFEGSLEMIRHTLHKFGMAPRKSSTYLITSPAKNGTQE
jgi:CPA2 family monovalent cation:H+ antiporter-2